MDCSRVFDQNLLRVNERIPDFLRAIKAQARAPHLLVPTASLVCTPDALIELLILAFRAVVPQAFVALDFI